MARVRTAARPAEVTSTSCTSAAPDRGSRSPPSTACTGNAEATKAHAPRWITATSRGARDSDRRATSVSGGLGLSPSRTAATTSRTGRTRAAMRNAAAAHTARVKGKATRNQRPSQDEVPIHETRGRPQQMSSARSSPRPAASS
jgi:hypothetical protein